MHAGHVASLHRQAPRRSQVGELLQAGGNDVALVVALEAMLDHLAQLDPHVIRSVPAVPVIS